MKKVKKVFGYILLIGCILFGLVLILVVLEVIPQIQYELSKSKSEGIGFLFGNVVGILFFVLLLVYFSKLALRLIKPNVMPEETIEDIGNH
ncbi:hypothetical protein [Flavobacterium geliluteum]|uniref:Uncharacterized protein n=1 Tax=Flavobacterium geliluteum TaxID=2816120 RepID=A0A940X9A5_9FLAO|nr:hypothetical protein [Flavobacterium geliluteum]MBP4139035.1 hypothetical protein [Flavobacterium geliluteum]